MTSDHSPDRAALPPTLDLLLAERDALRDEVEGLKAAIETVMRALKIALKEHNEARTREAVLIDLLRQCEGEGDAARALLSRCRPLLAGLGPDGEALIEAIDTALFLDLEGEDEDALD